MICFFAVRLEFLVALEHALEGEGFNTMTTWNASEATALLGSTRFDAVLVGEHPPGVKTGELLKQLQVEHRRIPCIVMQSAARHPFEAQFMRSRCVYRDSQVEPQGDCGKYPAEPPAFGWHDPGHHGRRTVLRLRLAFIIAGVLTKMLFRRWEAEAHRGHCEFGQRRAEEQKEYWDWRHGHLDHQTTRGGTCRPPDHPRRDLHGGIEAIRPSHSRTAQAPSLRAVDANGANDL